MSSFPDYYDLLHVAQSATGDEIRQAYKKESLRTHPDRLANASKADKEAATAKFQAVADAYYVLSDTTRRREYDALYHTRSRNDWSTQPDASSSFFNAFSGMFGGAAPGQSTAEDFTNAQRPDADGMFSNVFDEMLRPEVDRHVSWWTYVGAASGAGIGFIIANLPGLMVGAYGGKRLGAIRDAKGQSVAATFNSLGGNQKAEILRTLAMKILGAATQ